MTRKLVLLILLFPSLALADTFTSGDFGVKPLAQFHLDDCGTTSVYSWSPALKGTVQGACVQGVVGKALKFSNTNDVLSFSDAGFPTGSQSGGWSLSFWFRLDPNVAAGQDFMLWGVDGAATAWHFYLNDGAGHPGMGGDDRVGGSTHIFSKLTNVPNCNRWVFTYMYWNGTTMFVAMVVNGIAFRDSFAGWTPNIQANGTLYFGNYNPGVAGSNFAQGTFDDIRFFSGKDNFGRHWASYWDYQRKL